MTSALPHPRTIVGAVLAGVLASITILACFVVLDGLVLHMPGFSLTELFTFDAAALVGKQADGDTAYVALGVVLHVLVSIGWAVGYAIVAQRQIELRTRPFRSGAGFGLIVYFAMQLVLVAANLYRIPTPTELGVALLAHIGFYGIPIALIIARTYRPK